MAAARARAARPHREAGAAAAVAGAEEGDGVVTTAGTTLPTTPLDGAFPARRGSSGVGRRHNGNWTRRNESCGSRGNERRHTDAIASVRAEAWPTVTSADEMHEALTSLAAVTDAAARALSTRTTAPTASATATAPARQHGSELHLGAAVAPEPHPSGIFADLQSALDGVQAQAGRDLNRGVVEQLVLKL